MNGSALYQVSLLQALSLGRYEGSVEISELKKNGNIGIGTFDGLDGEMIMFALLCYYARKFDPDEVNEKTARRSNVFTILRERRADA